MCGPAVHTDGIAFIYDNESNDVIQQLRSMWTEMGDYLSRQYAGTDSTISRVTRDGREGFIGKLDHKTKVVRRFLINTLNENPMQTSIDIVQGKHLNSGYSSEQREYVDQQLRQMQDEFSIIDYIKVAVCSWNMGGCKPYSQIDLKDWLLPQITESADFPDILVIGIQHIYPNKSSSSSMFGQNNKNKDRLTFMQNNIMVILNTHAS